MANSKIVEQPEKVPLLEVKNFSLSFRHYETGLRETELEIVRNFNLTIHEGETVAVLGASGSGKSLLANAILGILPSNAKVSGTLKYKGKSLTKKRQSLLRGREISLIPQSVNALDPLMKTGKQIRPVTKKKADKDIEKDIFEKLGLPASVGQRYPFELSGGMARRILVSSAIVSSADLIIADEPTPGLDPAVLEETVRQMKQFAEGIKGMMFITHDIEAALKVADKIAVFYKGETIEIARSEDFSGKGEKLRHPYTKALWNALPKNDFISLKDRLSSEQDENTDMIPEKQKNNKLELSGISYRYPKGEWLFRNLDLTVMPGEILGIYGKSGSGKSTLAQIISGYKKPSEGSIRLGGEAIAENGRNPVQMVWQDSEKTINPRWKIKKTLQEGGPENQELFKAMGIKKEWMTRWPSELSGGELQRFCLTRVLMGKVDYLIADEITTMLDTVTQAQIWSSLIELSKEKEIGIIAISHDHQLLERICDRVIQFEDLK